MIKHKKRFTLFVTVLLSLLLALCSCGTYNPATGGWFGGGNSGGTSGGTSDDPVIDYTDEDLFSVTLKMNGGDYVPTDGLTIEAVWTRDDGQSLHKATVGDNGIAFVDGLDGDYTVTLTALPDGYAYDPNGQATDNYNRHITIDLRTITVVDDPDKGTSVYNSYNITRTGVYQIELSSVEDIRYFCYEPKAAGVYSIVSWADINKAEINPKLDYYYGMIQTGFRFAYELDDGGAEGAYTKNFKFEIEIKNDNYVGQEFTVGIKAESRKDEWPVTMLFAVLRNGDFDNEDKSTDLVIPTEDFVGKREKYGTHEYVGYTFVGAEEVRKNNAGVTFNVFDQSLYGLNPEDGWYHKLEDGQPTGPILYAKISQACRFIDLPLSTVEYQGNKMLTVNGENYKFFIEGRGSFAKGNSYFCVWDVFGSVYCPCMRAGNCIGACALGCTNCHEQCRNVDPKVLTSYGYADFCNSDGVYPVTKELQLFLQALSNSQRYFMDGEGFVETSDRISVYSDEESQWLFVCGYYKKAS